MPVLLVTPSPVGAEGNTAGTATDEVVGVPVPSMFFAETRTR